ncbi:MAG: glycosyltransferase, exosortase A system-associated [Chromatiales bacterium]|jgi:PEP-CTERM/exosortase A-associated glycosyltransferase
MKILHVFDHSIPLHSGYTFRSKYILKHQREMGWQTDHVTSPKHVQASGHPVAEETVEDYHFFRAPDINELLRPIPILNQLAIIPVLRRRIREAIETFRPDIVHAHSPALNGVAAIQASRKYGIPSVYEVRGFWEDAAVSHGTSKENGLRYKFTRGMETWALKHADAVTCICQGLYDDIHSRGIATDKMTIIPNAVDTSQFPPRLEKDEALATELGLQDKKVVGFLGSFYHYEGLNLLIDALPVLQAQDPTYHVLLVGGGPMEHDLKQQVQQLGLDQAVTFTGRVPHEEISRYYSLVDVLAYPRLSMRITELVTPLKPLEAMAQRRLFVASDVGGHRELVRDGETGILHKADDAQDLAKQIIRLMDNPQLWPQLQENGRHYVDSERTWKNSVANYQQVYPKLLNTD